MQGISLNSDQVSTQNLGSAPLNFTATYGKRFKLDQVLIHATQAITETVTITYISAKGTSYSTVEQSVNLIAQTDVVWRPQGEANFQSGDQIQVQCTNANGVGTVTITIKTSQLGSGGT